MSDSPKMDSKALPIVAWGISLLACLYFGWTYIQVSRRLDQWCPVCTYLQPR
jgi:hypothetical protein